MPGSPLSPFAPAGPEALKAPQAPETNRNHLIRASSPKPRPTIFLHDLSPSHFETALGRGERQDQRAESEIRTVGFSNQDRRLGIRTLPPPFIGTFGETG